MQIQSKRRLKVFKQKSTQKQKQKQKIETFNTFLHQDDKKLNQKDLQILQQLEIDIDKQNSKMTKTTQQTYKQQQCYYEQLIWSSYSSSQYQQQKEENIRLPINNKNKRQIQQYPYLNEQQSEKEFQKQERLKKIIQLTFQNIQLIRQLSISIQQFIYCQKHQQKQCKQIQCILKRSKMFQKMKYRNNSPNKKQLKQIFNFIDLLELNYYTKRANYTKILKKMLIAVCQPIFFVFPVYLKSFFYYQNLFNLNINQNLDKKFKFNNFENYSNVFSQLMYIQFIQKLTSKYKLLSLSIFTLLIFQYSSLQIFSSIQNSSSFDFYNVSQLNLSNSHIQSIQLLQRINFKKLQSLKLRNTLINNISSLKKLYCPKLEFLSIQAIYLNEIGDIHNFFISSQEGSLKNLNIYSLKMNERQEQRFLNKKGQKCKASYISDISSLVKVSNQSINSNFQISIRPLICYKRNGMIMNHLSQQQQFSLTLKQDKRRKTLLKRFSKKSINYFLQRIS